MNNPYIEALNKHREVVIVSNNDREYSAIFWKDAAGIICSFNHTFGILKRPEYTNERFLEHIKTMQEDNALIFIRGCND